MIIDEAGMVWDNVALRKESVDRNIPIPRLQIGPNSSLSARRAWIEIAMR